MLLMFDFVFYVVEIEWVQDSYIFFLAPPRMLTWHELTCLKSARHLGVAWVCAAQVSMARVDAAQVGAARVGAAQVRAAQVAAAWVSAVRFGTRKLASNALQKSCEILEFVPRLHMIGIRGRKMKPWSKIHKNWDIFNLKAVLESLLHMLFKNHVKMLNSFLVCI